MGENDGPVHADEVGRARDLNTTMRYVHLNDDDVRVAMEKRGVAKGGQGIGHSAENDAFFRNPCTEFDLKK
jgi:hypothetical protein